MNAEFLDRLRVYVAELTLGPSTLRNQGAPGVIRAGRAFVMGLDLAAFAVRRQAQFEASLDQATEDLRSCLPRGAQHWGSARKALNLFLRDVIYNAHLGPAFGVRHVQPWLEVPLDSYVAKGLINDARDRSLPRWPGIKWLKADVSADYQSTASEVARSKGIDRVDLDLWYFRRI